MIFSSCPGCPELPVGKIVCVGRNYADHAAEMGADPPAEPLLFLKPATALAMGGAQVSLPPWSDEVHHEVEMVVRVGSSGRNLDPAAAGSLLDAFGVGLDLTARDVQTRAKRAGEPWAVAKGWDGAAPLSDLEPLADVAQLADQQISLEVNGEVRQQGSTRDMLWSVPELVSFISTRFSLEAGDLVFTGTPAGVGPVEPGDRLVAQVGSGPRLELVIAP